MPILIVILIGWFDWLVYSALHRLKPLSAKMLKSLRGITFVQYLHSCALNDWCSHCSVTWCVLCFLFANWSSKHSIMSMSIVREILTSQHSN